MGFIQQIFGKGGTLDDYIKLIIRKVEREENN